MVKTLTRQDIRDLLSGFAAAIELDQLRVDSMPQQKFHPYYSEDMWRGWRKDHLIYIDELLATVGAISANLLEELTRVALSHEPAVIGQIALDVFSDVVGGCCPREEFDSAELFFARVVQDRGSSERESADRDAKDSMFQWLPVTDPLRIAQDPECGYGQPVGFIS
jgi:hypothetical protein